MLEHAHVLELQFLHFCIYLCKNAKPFFYFLTTNKRGHKELIRFWALWSINIFLWSWWVNAEGLLRHNRPFPVVTTSLGCRLQQTMPIGPPGGFFFITWWIESVIFRAILALWTRCRATHSAVTRPVHRAGPVEVGWGGLANCVAFCDVKKGFQYPHQCSVLALL